MANAQTKQVEFVKFSSKKNLPGTVSAWNKIPGAIVLEVQKTPGVQLPTVWLEVELKKNNKKICTGKMKIDSINTRTIKIEEITRLLKDCPLLAKGEYKLCARFYNMDNVGVSEVRCTELTISN